MPFLLGAAAFVVTILVLRSQSSGPKGEGPIGALLGGRS
jgi:hypothetical protein